MIKVKTNIATREPVPSFLIGLAQSSLLDLSWTDPALGVSDCAWWPEDNQSPALGQYERYGEETLTVDAERQVVVTARTVVPWSQEEIEAEEQKRKDALKALMVQQAQMRLDTWARERGYDGIQSACTYATDPDPQFSAEGQAAVNARSGTWRTLWTLLDEVLTGSRPVPTSFADIEPELPVLVWS